MNVLLIIPSMNQKGGVAEFGKLLLKYGTVNFHVLQIGSGTKTSKPAKLVSLASTFLRLNYLLLFKSIDVVHVNPSLGKNAVYRDGNFVRIAGLFRKKVFVHWHGWNPDNEFLLEGKHLAFLQKTFFRANHIKVLSEQIQTRFLEKGFKNKLTTGNTFVDDELITKDPATAINEKSFRILFLSTVSKNKGIYTALECFEQVQKQFKDTELIIAGDGIELENVKRYVLSKNLKNVEFTGHVEGSEKQELLREASIYLFPSHYEGMPTSVLEAMGLGLPVVCSNAGALPDFFEDGRMGFMLDSLNSEEYADRVIQLINDKELREKISLDNMEYAKRRFLASESVKRIEEDYKRLLADDQK